MAEPYPTPTTNHFVDLTHHRSHRLIVLRYHECRNQNRFWWCYCDCGTEVSVCSRDLLNRNDRYRRKYCSHQCIFFRKEVSGFVNLQHGKSKTAEYRIYRGMLNRCFLKTLPRYADYGGRGITVCDRWRGPQGFLNFLADMGSRPSALHSLDRFPDQNGNYEPSNCRWATDAEQNRNTTNNHWLTFNGRTMLLTDWANELGFTPSGILQRLNRGWSVERTLTTPKDKRGKYQPRKTT